VAVIDLSARAEVVYTEHIVVIGDEAFAQLRAEEAGCVRHQYPFAQSSHLGLFHDIDPGAAAFDFAHYVDAAPRLAPAQT
jgi:hypothetical protein